MKLIFNHVHSIFDGVNPLIYLEAEKETESAEYMFNNGWVPYKDIWYQTQSSRLKLSNISTSRKKELNNISVTHKTNNCDITIPYDIDAYSDSKHLDFFFDDIFWGRINFYENQILYSVMNTVQSKKSYGTLSYYYLIDKFKSEYEYLYVTDYFHQFDYKSSLPGFEYWNGNQWIKKNKKD